MRIFRNKFSRMPEASSIRNRALVWLIWLSLALGTLACYWPSRHYDYVNYDDWVYVYDNPIVERGVTWAGIKWALKSTEGGNWHPLVWISHMADCRIFGPTAGGHHLTNVLLHIAMCENNSGVTIRAKLSDLGEAALKVCSLECVK